MNKIKLVLVFIGFSLFFTNVFAEIISPETAQKAAKNFYHQQFYQNEFPPIDELPFFKVKIRGDLNNDLFYIFNVGENDGFVIVSADDGLPPILGFSDKGTFPVNFETLPPGLAELLNNYAKQAEYAVSHKITADANIAKRWQELLTLPIKPNPQRAVTSLISTNWAQTCYYNEFCPYDATAPTGFCSHAQVGCVAVAMGQVMKYWNYPQKGTGTHAYTSAYGVLSADFENTTYNYPSMPNQIGSSNPDVATLLYQCGVSVNMQYGSNGSGSLPSAAKDALINFFGYSADALYLPKSSYSDAAWEGMLRAELDAAHPLIYAGTGIYGGHAWVCDGYNGTNYFHFNWGWNGYANGYFYLTKLNPGGYDFTSAQVAIIGIQPGEIVLDPPTNLNAEVVGSDVNLSWEAPVIPYQKWLHWDDGVCSTALGYGASPFYVAAMWTAAQIAPYSGKYLTKVSFVPCDANSLYEIRIYKGTNAYSLSLLLSQTATNLNYGTWNVVTLTTPVPIDATKQLWVGYKISNTPAGVYPVGMDAGPAVPGLVNKISTSGTSWSNINPGLNYNLNIQAFITDAADGKDVAILPLEIDFSEPSENPVPVIKEMKPGISFANQTCRSSQLLGYNAYRDNVKINSGIITGLTFTDLNVPSGSHNYKVTAMYNVGESPAAGPVTISVGSEEQILQLAAGWNSISSFLIPENPAISQIANPISGDLVIIKNMTGTYYPEGSIYTLENWSRPSGYLIKVLNNCQLSIAGTKNSDRTIALSAGWNLISVLSDCDVMTVDLFSGISASLEVVKEATGQGIYWPSQGGNTLPVMRAGKSYFVRMTSSQTLTFPDCD